VILSFEENTVKKVMIIMGSYNDLDIVSPAFSQLEEFGIPFEKYVASAHRTPEKVTALVKSTKENGFGVVIAAAGMAAHLAGVVASQTVLPVIGVPLKGSFEGLDALLSTVQMPAGIPVATVAVNGSKNAAVLAAEILSVSDDELYNKLIAYRQKLADFVEEKDRELNKG
jgi:5-(carboxyamino)imidazole ribonucleotide mutase